MTYTCTAYYPLFDTADFGPQETLDVGDLLPGFSCRAEELFDFE